MIITEKDMVHKALKFCRDGNSCHKCPYYAKRDCVEILEHKATELYISEHPEIFNEKEVKE